MGLEEIRIENADGKKTYVHKDNALRAARKTDPVHNGTAGEFDGWADAVDTDLAALRSSLASVITGHNAIIAFLNVAPPGTPVVTVVQPAPAIPSSAPAAMTAAWTPGDTIAEIKEGSADVEIGHTSP